MAIHYKNLVVWQRADDLFIEIHHLTYQRFPREELRTAHVQARSAQPANWRTCGDSYQLRRQLSSIGCSSRFFGTRRAL